MKNFLRHQLKHTARYRERPRLHPARLMRIRQMRQKRIRQFSRLSLLLVIACRCSKAPVFNDLVEGTANLDGKPSGDAHIQFVPNEPHAKAPGSSAITDENGHSRLKQEDDAPGALVGRHLVLIRGREANRARGEQAGAGDVGRSAKGKKDWPPIPPVYTMASPTPEVVDKSSM